MKYFSCQPDSHNAFVSYSNCTLSYFSVDSPHYLSLAAAAAASAPSTPTTSPAAVPPPGVTASSAARAPGQAAPFTGQDPFAAFALPSGAYDTAKPPPQFNHPADGSGPSTWNRNLSSTRLHIQHVVTLPDCFHSATVCFGIANHSLFGVDMTVLGTSTGLLALIIPRQRTLIYARGKDPTDVRKARQRVRYTTTSSTTTASSSSAFHRFDMPDRATRGEENGREDHRTPASASSMVLEVPTTITWMRDKPIVLVGYNTGLVEWYEVRVHPSKAREFTDPSMETAYGPPLPANALMPYINNPAANPIEKVYAGGEGDGVWLDCQASFHLPDSGALTSSDHFPATGHCVVSGERGLYVFSATRPGAPLCQLSYRGADFLYCHPCLPFIATLTYSWNARQAASSSSGVDDARSRRAQSPADAQRRRQSHLFGNTHDASTVFRGASGGGGHSDCLLHVYEYVERPWPTPVSAPEGRSAYEAEEPDAPLDAATTPTATTTGPRVAFRVDSEEAVDLDDVADAHRPRRRLPAQRGPRFQLVPVLERLLHASLPRYGAYYSLSWKFSFDLELVVCNAEEGWMRVLRLAKRGVGVQRVPPLLPLHPMADGDSALVDPLHGTLPRWDRGGTLAIGATGSVDSLSSSQDGVHLSAAKAARNSGNTQSLSPYVVVHEHRLRIPLHSLINIEYVSAATSALEASSLSHTPVRPGGAADMDGQRMSSLPNTSAGKATATTTPGHGSPLPQTTLGAAIQAAMPTDTARHHRHTLFTNSAADEHGPRTSLQARGSRWLQSMRSGGNSRVFTASSSLAREAANADLSGFSASARQLTPSRPLPGSPASTSALLLKENLLAMQLLQPTQSLRRGVTSRSRTSSLGRSHTHTYVSSHAPASSAGASARGGAGPSATDASAAAVAALQALLHVGAGRFSTCVGMNLAGEIAAVPVDREPSLTWHDEGSVFVGLGSTLCAADIVTIQGVERHMKRRMEKGFGISAKNSLVALRSVGAAHRNVDMEVLCSYIDLMETAGLAASFGPVPSLEELVTWPTRPSLTRLVRQQCLPAYAVRQLQRSRYAADSRRMLLLHVLNWLPCSSRVDNGTRTDAAAEASRGRTSPPRSPPAGTTTTAGRGPSAAGGGGRGLPEWRCGEDVRVSARSTSGDVERAAAVEVLHGRLREGSQMLLDYQSLDITFTSMAALLISPEETLSALQNSDDRVRDAFLRSLSPWMLVMLLYVCSGVQHREGPPRTPRSEDTTATATSPPSLRAATGDTTTAPADRSSRGSLQQLLRGYRVYVLRHQGIPLWDRIAIATILEPNTQGLLEAFRTHLVPDCNLLQALVLEHGISSASYPHMQEVVDSSGNFQLAACLYARVGAVSQAALRLAAAEARLCTAWKLSASQTGNGETDEDDDGIDDPRTAGNSTSTTPAASVRNAHDLGDATTTTAPHELSVNTAPAATTGDDGTSVPSAGTAADGTLSNGAAHEPPSRLAHHSLAPITLATKPDTTASGSGSRAACIPARAGALCSPTYDPYLTFSPTTAGRRQRSFSASLTTPLLSAADAGEASGGATRRGSAFEVSPDRREGETWSRQPSTIGTTLTTAAATPNEDRGGDDGSPASARLARLQRLLQRSQLPAMVPELCGFGAPLAPITDSALAADDAHDANHFAAATPSTATNHRIAGTAPQITPHSGRTADGGTDAPPRTEEAESALTALAVARGSLHGADGTGLNPVAHATSTTGTAASAGSGATASVHHSDMAALSPSVQRAIALRALIFGFSVPRPKPLGTTPSLAYSSNASLAPPSAPAVSTMPAATNAITMAADGDGVGEDDFNPWLWWVEAYRAFLDSEQAFVKRTSFDIECRQLKQLADEAVAAAATAAESTQRPRDRLARLKGRRHEEVPTHVVVVADGTGLRQPLEQLHPGRADQAHGVSTASAANAAAVVAAAANVVIVEPTSADVVQRCVCGEHHFLTSQPLRRLLLGMAAGLPHCSVCDEVVEAVPARDVHAVDAVTKTTTALGWCTACMHGGHTNHLQAWFMAHMRCPVDGCSCHCNEESNLF